MTFRFTFLNFGNSWLVLGYSSFVYTSCVYLSNGFFKVLLMLVMISSRLGQAMTTADCDVKLNLKLNHIKSL